MSQRVMLLTAPLSTGLTRVHGQAPAGSFKTPWGEPDLQGLWTSEPELGVPFERPAEFGERQTLTDAEFAPGRRKPPGSWRPTTPSSISRRSDTANAGAVGWRPRRRRTGSSAGSRRAGPSLVIDLPDGRVPAMTR